ncbi:MAG: nitrous oxide reductase accessory protein NosL [Bacteroidia bacterium]|nr:nitrous oxide reductase accessory protein NosL [Bacteroidia bacterium]
MRFVQVIGLFAFMISMGACSISPKPIVFGTDDCDHCKMTISDTRYGAELVTKKGRIYKFDDLHCLKGFMDEQVVPLDNIHSLWVIDFSVPETLTQLEQSFLLHNEQLQSPMGSNTAAFAIQDSLDVYFSKYKGNKLKWEDFISSH